MRVVNWAFDLRESQCAEISLSLRIVAIGITASTSSTYLAMCAAVLMCNRSQLDSCKGMELVISRVLGVDVGLGIMSLAKE